MARLVDEPRPPRHPWAKCRWCDSDRVTLDPTSGVWICRHCDSLKDWPRYQAAGNR